MRPKEKEEKEEEKGRGAADLAVVNGGACGSRLLGCDPRRCYCSCFLLPCAEAPASGFPPPSSASFFFSILCSSLFFFFLSFLSSSVLIVPLKSQNNSPTVFFSVNLPCFSFSFFFFRSFQTPLLFSALFSPIFIGKYMGKEAYYPCLVMVQG